MCGTELQESGITVFWDDRDARPGGQSSPMQIVWYPNASSSERKDLMSGEFEAKQSYRNRGHIYDPRGFKKPIYKLNCCAILAIYLMANGVRDWASFY